MEQVYEKDLVLARERGPRKQVRSGEKVFVDLSDFIVTRFKTRKSTALISFVNLPSAVVKGQSLLRLLITSSLMSHGTIKSG